MDKTTKFLLGLIAVGLIAINIQLYGGATGLIKPAMADLYSSELKAGQYPLLVKITNWP